MANFFNLNKTPDTGSTCMYQLISTLLSGGWTQVGSGDATTFTNSASGPVSSSGTGAGGLGNNAAWVRLQMPVQTYASIAAKRELLIQRGNSDVNWWIRYSCSASFIGTGSGAISATVAPTALDSVNMWGSAQAGTQMFDTNGIYRTNVMAQGASPYGFYLVNFSLGGSLVNGFCRSVIMLDPMQSASPSDPDPYVLYADNSSDVIFNVYSAGSGRFYTDATSNFLACFSTVTSSANYKNCNTAVYSPTFHADAVPGQDPFANAEITLPILYCRRVGAASPTGPKGFSTIMSYAPMRRSTGALISVASASANDRMCVGDVCFLWNGTFPVVV